MWIHNKEIAMYVHKLLSHYLCYEVRGYIAQYIPSAWTRFVRCLSVSKNKYFINTMSKKEYLDSLNTTQNAIFFYILANEIYRNGQDEELASAIYYLNRIMNQVEWFYAIELPEYFGAEHPIGSVLGRARYSNGFYFYQGCTVGGNRSSDGSILYPCIGKNVLMYSNSSLIGDCNIGNFVILGTGTTIVNEDIPDYSLVFGQSPNLIIKQKDRAYMENKLSLLWSNEKATISAVTDEYNGLKG